MAEIDLKSVADSGVDPITGSPLSKEVRQAIFNNTSISSSIFRNNQTFISKYTQDNEEKVQLIESNQQYISSLGFQIQSLQQQVNNLNAGLIQISTLIQNDAQVEQQRILSQADRDRKLAEEEVRIGKENQIEKKLESALVAPVTRITPKLTDIFGRIQSALGFLFAGWLTDQIVKYFDEQQKGDTNNLKKIKNNIIKHLGYAVGALLLIKGGFNLIIKTLGSVVMKITGLIGKIITAPIKAVVNQTKKLIGGGEKGVTEGATKGVVEGEAKGAGEGILKNVSRGLGGIARTAVNAVVGVSEFVERKKEGQTTLQAGAGTLGSMYAAEKGAELGAKLLPGPLKLPGMIGGGAAGFILGGKGIDFLTGANKPETKESSKPTTPTQTTTKATKPTEPIQTTTKKSEPTVSAIPESNKKNTENQEKSTTVASSGTGNFNFNIDTSKPEIQRIENSSNSQPQTPAIPPPPSSEMSSKFQMAWDNRNNPLARGRIESAWDQMSPEQQQQAKIWAQTKGYNWNEMKLKEKSANLQAPPKPSVPVGSLPEAKPTIIMASQNGQNQVSSPPPAPSNISLSDVPLIRSSNPDNFYTLYAQLNYNVVM
jgi:hypothetical protein